MSVKLGHFELLEQIGKGGMAAVFRAYDPSLNRKVAIKLLDEELAQQDPQFVENFIHEAQSAAAINHPNIVQIYFVGEENGNYYIAMELLEGRSLDEIIKEEGPQSEDAVLRIGIQMTDALHAAYANQMIHGDIKPQNIFITNNGTAKLLDFGLAKMANIEVATESDGSVWGSAYYISPERVGHKAEDFRSDIYSLGATLFHALVGHPPFDADTPEELAAKRLSEKAPTLRRINPDISAKTEQIIARMLNKSTFLRYLDYDSLLKDLRTAESKTDGKVTTSISLQQQQLANTAELAAQIMASTANLARLANTGNIPEGHDVSRARPKKNPLPLILACSAATLIIGGGAFALFKMGHNKQGTTTQTTPVENQTSTPAPSSTTSADLVSVPFHYDDQTAKKVALAGSFNNWKPEPMTNSGGVWTISKNLKYMESYDYQFVVDGRSIPDPKRTRSKPDGRGGEMSVFTVSIRVYPQG
ncbi:MAG: protein kinase [Verrucomicrobiota bacterium]